MTARHEKSLRRSPSHENLGHIHRYSVNRCNHSDLESRIARDGQSRMTYTTVVQIERDLDQYRKIVVDHRRAFENEQLRREASIRERLGQNVHTDDLV